MDRIIEISHYLPLATTVMSAIFSWVILSRYLQKKQSRHLLWWGVGVAVYGVGTLLESMNTLLGWH